MLNYCIVKQRIGAITEDTPDDDDRYPDYTSVFGQIVFTPSMANGSAYKITDDEGVVHTVPATRINAQIVNGEIIHEGLPGLPLFAAGPNANPSTIVYTATYNNLTAAGRPVTLNNITFRALPGQTIDLSSYTPVAGTPTPGIIQGPPGHTPYIGVNGNWWINNRDTDVVATSPLVHSYEEVKATAENALDRVSALEKREGLAPLDPIDGQTANLVLQPDTDTHTAIFGGTLDMVSQPGNPIRDELVRATAAPAIMSVASSVVAKNLANGALPPMLPLLTGSPDEVIPNFSIQDPAENVPCPTRPGRTVWRIVGRGTGAATIRADRAMPEETNVMPASALSAWVYLPDPSKITHATLIITGAEGAWNGNTTSSGGQEFHKGWNLVRFPTHTSTYAVLDKITLVSIRIHYAGDGTDVEVLFGPLVAEKRPKASLVVINDWGSKEFYDNAYPLLKAAGIPVTWALRVNLLGDNSNPPNGHITLEQAKELMWENNNVVSFHSWQGNATLDLTAEEARDETIKAQAGLLARGLWSEGAVHRPAWVQNQAPNAYGADNYLATSGTPGDQYAPSPWPPVDRLKIPRFGLNVERLAPNLELMKKTHYNGLTYTHGVLAPPYTHEEALPNHIGMSVFQDSLALITAGMAEGWLECTTMPDLVARERMEIPQEPPL